MAERFGGLGNRTLLVIVLVAVVAGLVAWIAFNSMIATAQPETETGSNVFKIVFKTYISPSLGWKKTHILGVELPNNPVIKPYEFAVAGYGEEVTVKVSWYLYKWDESQGKFVIQVGYSGEKKVSTKIGKTEEVPVELRITEPGIYMLQVFTEIEGAKLSIDTYAEAFQVVG